MIFVKISNLTDKFGQPDYRHLDIKQFIPGSQVYSEDFQTFACATQQDVTEGNGVELITETEYDAFRAEVIRQQTNDQQSLTQLKNEIELLKLVIDDIILNGGAF